MARIAHTGGRRGHALALGLLALLLLGSCGVDSDRFRLEGRLRNMHQGEFWVYSTDGGIDGIDTIPVREGRFVYEIPMRSPSTLVIVFPNYSELPVFARPGAEVEIKGDATHLREMAINGTDENGEMTKLRMELNRLMPPEVPGKVEEFIRENPESEVSVYLLQRYFLQEDAADYKRAMALVELMLKEQPDNGRLIEWKKQLPALCRGMVKAKLPAFTASDVKGRTVTQDELKKKANVLTVWASWSFQSTDMQRRLIRLKKDYGERLGVVSICLDARPQDCRQRVERDSLPWKTVCDGRVWQTPLLAKLGISEVPASMVIDSRGVIVARDLAPQELEDELKKMLK
ncbi:MAG: AhpC/TSA family protein [Prevotella sp.]|nr:AhpC/TSA family protein [Prevotella sp.]